MDVILNWLYAFLLDWWDWCKAIAAEWRWFGEHSYP